jgi:hypothetical protein
MDNEVSIQKWSSDEGQWITIPFEQLKSSDIFRMFYSNVRHTDNDNNNVWICISDAYKNEDNIYTVDTLY